MKKLLIMGAHVPEIIRLVNCINIIYPKSYQVVGFIDNDDTKTGKSILGVPILGNPKILTQSKYQKCYVINNITRDPQTRKKTTEQLKAYTDKFITLVHPTVNTDYVKIGIGSIIHEGCIISPGAIIGDHTAIMLGARIAHDSNIGNFCFIAPGVIINGIVNIGNECSIGAGSIILPRITIGSNVKIGAGSLIGENVSENLFVMGNPPRIIPI
jgi:sugar O-acyltransferase (sialic acid O-acetyltransferase NeuD family)